jgi:hypothetical protein
VFNKAGFIKAAYVPRTETVPMPQLKDWFEEGETPEFTVRGLTAEEIAKSNEAVANSRTVDTMLKAISNSRDQIEAIRKTLGLNLDAPEEFVKRLSQLTFGAVEPAFTMTEAIVLGERFPVELYLLTNKIVELTSLGMDLAKQKLSGNNPA